jgi:hypothetical protein
MQGRAKARMSQRVTALLDLIDGADVRDRIRQMITSLGSVSESDTESLCASFDSRLLSIRSSLQDVCYEGDMSEAEGMLPWIWLELRFEWMRYNSQMQYQTVMLGTADPVLMARGAALSFLIEGIEQQLDATELFTVTRLAADPVGIALGSIQRTDRLFSVMAAASLGGRDAVESLLMAQEKIARSTDSAPVQQEMTDAISAVMQKVGDALRVTSADFGHALQGVLLRCLGQAPVLVTLHDASPDPAMYLPSAVANGLLHAAGAWMDAMRDTALQTQAVERMAVDRPAFVTITAALTSEQEQIVLTLADDADGTVIFRPDMQDWPIRDLRLQLEQRADVGSTMRFACDVTNITDYLVLRVGCATTDVLVSVPSRAVHHIEQREADGLTMSGTALVDRLDGGAHAMLDLGSMLFGEPIDSASATYVHVRPDARGDRVYALRVRAVTGICRGVLKPVPPALGTAPLRGFVMSGRDIVAVLDLDQLGPQIER